MADAKTEPMRGIVNRILNEYAGAKQQQFAGHPIGSFFRNDIPNTLYSTNIVNPQTHLITGSVGQGGWAGIPWICIFDRTITTTAQSGVYIVYLLSKNCDSLYLTLNQGCTEISNRYSKKETNDILRSTSNEIRNYIDPRSFSTDGEIFLGDNLSSLGDFYQKGVIFYKEYKKGNVPSESELQTDLIEMMQIYADYVKYKNTGVTPEKIDSGEHRDDGGESALTVRDTISVVKSYISAKGFSYEDGLIENFYLCLKTKPFVILAGTSGTGKTRLVRLFAEAVGATVGNSRFRMVPVRPDWSDSTDLYGYKDLNGNFIPGAIIDFVKQAENDRIHPYFLCLDEMNLARVEYYLSDFLSIIETRRFEGDKVITDPMLSDLYYGTDQSAVQRYGTICLPENLYIIGTVNMDETTFPFSRKVLDRANTIEFSFVDLLPNIDAIKHSIPPLIQENDF